MADVVVKFEGNTSHLERSLKRVHRGLGTVEKNAARSSKALQNISATGNRVTTALRAAGAALVAFGGVSVIRGIVETTARFQDLRTTLASVTGSAQAGAEAFDFVSKFSTQTQFGVEELTQSYIKLQSNGITPSTQLLTTFTDAAAVTTDQIGSLQAITDFYTRSLQSQTVELMDLDRLADRGLPVYDILKEKLGVSRSELSKFSKEAGNTEKIIEALGEGINERFGGATAARINNISTQFSNLKIAAQLAQDAVGRQGLAKAMGETAEKITEMINNNDELIEKIGRGLTTAFLYVIEISKFLIKNIELIGKAFLALMAIKVGLFFLGVAKGIGAILIPALITGGKALKKFGAILINFIPGGALVKTVLKGLGLVAGALGVVKVASSDAGDSILDMMPDFDEIAKGLGVEGLDELRAGLEGVTAEVNRLSDEAKAAETPQSNFNAQLTEQEKKARAAEIAQENHTKAIKDYTQEAEKSAENVRKSLNLELRLLGESQNVRAAHLKAQQAEVEFRKANKEATDDEAEAFRKGILARELENAAIRDQIAVQEELLKFRKAATEVEVIAAGRSAFGRLNPLEGMNKTYETELKGLERLRREDLIDEREYLRTKEKLNREHTKKVMEHHRAMFEEQLRASGVTNDEIINVTMNAMKQKDMILQGGVQGVQGALGMIGSFLEQAGKQSKEAFEANKAIAIAQTMISTYQAATQAFAAMSVIPVIGPALGFAAAATIVAAGLANVQAIKSQSYSGRRFGGPVSEGETYMVGENGPEMFTPASSGRITPNDELGGGQTVNVNFTINAMDTTSFDEMLLNRRGVIQQVIRDAVLETGQRSRF